MPVTLEPIAAFELKPAFWNLPTATSDGKPIDYFTFSGRWNQYPTRDVRALTEWQLVATQQLDTPEGSILARLTHVHDHDLWDEQGHRYEGDEPMLPEERTDSLLLTPDQFDALVVWLRKQSASAYDLHEASLFFEPLDSERLAQMSVPMDPLWTTTGGGQPYRYYLFHPSDAVKKDDAYSLVSLSGWTAPNARLSATKDLRFDTYTPEWLARIHSVQARYRDSSKPVPRGQWGLFTGRGQSALHVTPSTLAALATLLERHRFPQSNA
jgi:hypothetical protein